MIIAKLAQLPARDWEELVTELGDTNPHHHVLDSPHMLELFFFSSLYKFIVNVNSLRCFFSQVFTIHYCTFNFPSIHVDVVVQSDYFLATKMIMTISFTSQIYTYVLLKYTHVLAVYERI